MRFGGHFDAMATNTKQYGPKGVRMERIQLTLIDTESEHTGWRKPNKERQETLKNIFLGGQYGLGVSNGVQILEKESGLGQKIIDDGVSTVAALKACAAEYADDSSLTREIDANGSSSSWQVLKLMPDGQICKVMSPVDFPTEGDEVRPVRRGKFGYVP